MARIRAFEDAAEEASSRAASPPSGRAFRARTCAGRCTCRPARKPWPPVCARICERATCSPPPTAATATRWPRAPTPARMMAELFGARDRHQPGQGRLDAHRRLLGRHAGRQRRGRGRHPDRGRRGARARHARRRRRGGLLLRRRRDQPRPVPRGAELGGGVQAAGPVRLRGQPLVGDHRDRVHDRGRRRARARGGDRRAGARGRRQRRVRGLAGDAGAAAGRARRRGRASCTPSPTA